MPDRVSHLAWLCDRDSGSKAIKRLEELYAQIFIDELQDYAGWDLEIISLLFKSSIPVTCVGDYKQATYRTNNSPKNKQYRDENIRKYFIQLQSQRLCDILYANTTRRFNKEICDFINTIHADVEANVLPDPTIDESDLPENSGVYIMGASALSTYCEHYNPVILRYDKNVEIPFPCNCEIFNYGGSKGATYERVVIIPVGTSLPFIQKQKKITSNQTRAKFYVACTRARHSVVFAVDNPQLNSSFQATEVKIADRVLPAYKYVSPQYNP